MGFEPTINTGTTPGDGQGAGLRTNMRKLIANDGFLKAKVDAVELSVSTIKNDLDNNPPGIVDTSGILTLVPIDGRNSFIGYRVSGAIKIQLPQAWSNTMIKLFIEIYDHYNNESVSLILSGFTPIFGNWYYTSSQIITSKADRNFAIRYGYHEGNCFIYIGELNSTWSSLKVAVTNIFISNNYDAPSSWLTGWEISLETSSFQGITSTQTNNLPVSQ